MDCPLLWVSVDAKDKECLKERCGWWNKNTGSCVVLR